MKNQLLLYAFLFLIIISCKKDENLTPDFLQGKWNEEVEEFQTHRNYYSYTFHKNSNECHIFILRDKYYYTTDTTIFKKYALDPDNSILTIFEGISINENKNVEKYKVSLKNSTIMHWIAVEENGRVRKMKKQKMGD